MAMATSPPYRRGSHPSIYNSPTWHWEDRRGHPRVSREDGKIKINKTFQVLLLFHIKQMGENKFQERLISLFSDGIKIGRDENSSMGVDG